MHIYPIGQCLKNACKCVHMYVYTYVQMQAIHIYILGF